MRRQPSKRWLLNKLANRSIRRFVAASLLSLAAIFFVGSAQATTVFYLHGKIVEDKGDGAQHPKYGAYRYVGVLSTLKDAGYTVISEIRPAGTDRDAYAQSVVRDIKGAIASGTAPSDIVVIGFSKGAQIAMLVSQQLKMEDVRFVFQAVCGSWVARRSGLAVTGNILSMYEKSDGAGSCEALFVRSPVMQTCEIAFDTGLGHGLFYQPRDVWTGPLWNWIDSGICPGNGTQ